MIEVMFVTISRRPHRLVEDFPKVMILTMKMWNVREDCEGVYVEEDIIIGKKRKRI